MSEERWAQREGLRVYSDGSELEGGVGAAAVLFNERTREWTSLRLFLGPAEQHTVYEAETVGAVLGTELVKRSRRRDRVASTGNRRSKAPSSVSRAQVTISLIFYTLGSRRSRSDVLAWNSH